MGRPDGGRASRRRVRQSVGAGLSAPSAEADHLPPTHRRKWLYYKLFPCVAFDIYPDQVDFMQWLPVSATTSVIREISYALPDDRREMKAARYLNWRINRRVNAEDTELISRVQQGMASPTYIPGPLGKSEVRLRSFARKLRADSFRRRGWSGRRRRAGPELEASRASPNSRHRPTSHRAAASANGRAVSAMCAMAIVPYPSVGSIPELASAAIGRQSPAGRPT